MAMTEIEKLAAFAGAQQDFNKESKGAEYEKNLPIAGVCVLRFREYVEIGMQPTKSVMYPNKKPARKARFVFELTTPKHQYEIEADDKSKKKYGHTISITISISNSPKSNFMKLFKQLNWAGSANVPAQLLGQAYKALVVHVYDEADMVDGKPKADAKPKWANLQLNGVYTFEAPRIVDPLAENPADSIREIKVPAMLGTMKLFLWDMPNKATWDSIFVDGSYTKSVEGKPDVEISKNWLQQACLDALDYQGSKLQELIEGAGETLDDLPSGGDADALGSNSAEQELLDDLV